MVNAEQWLLRRGSASRIPALTAVTNTDDLAIGGKYLKNGAAVDPHDMLHGDINLTQYSLG